MAAALKGGTDLNCGCYYERYLAYALGNKTVPVPEVDLAAGRVIFALIRTGALDAAGAASPYAKVPKSLVDDAGEGWQNMVDPRR